MRITIEEAKGIATKLVEPLMKEIDDLHKDIVVIADKCIEEGIPQDIFKASKQFPKYFKFSRHVNLTNGSQVIGVDNVTEYPSTVEGGYYTYYRCTPEEAETVRKLVSRMDQKSDERTKLKNTIRETLLQLRTYKKIREQFPETAEYLEEEGVSTEIALPINDIRNILSKYKE